MHKQYRIGYTQGVYDMFHIGHLNILNKAKEYCEYLIVGVNADELVKNYKNKYPIIKEQDRAEIVRNIKAVDECIIVNTLDKVVLLKQYGFHAVFIGDDWKGSARWVQTTEELAKHGVDVIYLPHTDGVSSTMLREEIGDKNASRSGL